MGDLIDSIFQRQCSLTDSKDRDRSGQQDATDVTILEVGAQKTVGEVPPRLLFIPLFLMMRFSRGCG